MFQHQKCQNKVSSGPPTRRKAKVQAVLEDEQKGADTDKNKKLPNHQAKKYKKHSTTLPTDLNKIKQMREKISKKLQGFDIDQKLSLQIIKSALLLQEEHLKKRRKNTQKESNLRQQN